MSTPLEQFRDHCLRMTTDGHADDCKAVVPQNGWRGSLTKRPDPACTGDCIPASDRVLFSQLAGEVDAYLAGELIPAVPNADDTPLF